MIYIWLIFAILIAIIGIAYYYDYKSDKKEFRFSVLNIGKKILEYSLILLILFGIKSAYSYFIPLNKTHGVEYNSERLKLGIPQISDNLKYIPEWSEQFEIVWYDENSKNGHFKKVIEYGILALLVLKAIQIDVPKPASYGYAFVIVSAFGWIDEGIQYLLPNFY